MPIGWLMGLSVGIMIAGVIMGMSNSHDPRQPNDVAMARSKARLTGLTMLFAGAGSLIGTIIELVVR